MNSMEQSKVEEYVYIYHGGKKSKKGLKTVGIAGEGLEKGKSETNAAAVLSFLHTNNIMYVHSFKYTCQRY